MTMMAELWMACLKTLVAVLELLAASPALNVSFHVTVMKTFLAMFPGTAAVMLSVAVLEMVPGIADLGESSTPGLKVMTEAAALVLVLQLPAAGLVLVPGTGILLVPGAVLVLLQAAVLVEKPEADLVLVPAGNVGLLEVVFEM